MVVLTKIQQWGLGALASVILVTMGYCAGTRRQAANDALAANSVLIQKSDSVSKSVQIRVNSSKTAVSILTNANNKAKSGVRIVHDTVFTPGHTYVDTVLVNRLNSADALIAGQSRALALEDTLVASLNIGIHNRDDRIKILMDYKQPRITHGLQVGVGYCRNATGGSPCVFVGYGFSFRF
jgi:Ulp1 family protease